MELVEFNSKYKDIFINNNLVDFNSIYNYHSDEYFTKNPLRNVISFGLNGEIFFLKRHISPVLRAQNFCARRTGDIGNSPAKREWDNIFILNKSGFKTMEPVAYGIRTRKIGAGHSFIVTKKLQEAVSLEKYITGTFEKQKLIKNLAYLARRFHNMGFCHQDFYAGHIFLKKDELYLIDVQRLLQKKKLSNRWRIKDIAQLNYTVPGNIVSTADKLRFIKYYFGISKLDKRSKVFIKKVQNKTKKIARHTQNLISKGKFNY